MSQVKINKNLIKQIEDEAKKYFQKASGCHDWTHVERVRALALKIGKKEKADLGILELAALLHDVAKPQEMKIKGRFCHAEIGAEIATKILRKHKLGKNIIDRIEHCIAAHRNKNKNAPATLEAIVLYDADKLDALGAIGAARLFQFAGYIAGQLTVPKLLYTGREKQLIKSGRKYDYTPDDTAILEYEKEIKFIKDKLLTKEGRRIGKERHKYMENFFKRFWEEVRAEK
jgi:uncharacterized protein